MSEKIKVLHKVVRVKMPARQQNVKMKRCEHGVKRAKGLGSGKPFETFMEFKRMGPSGLSPRPANTLGHGRQAILQAYQEALVALKQYVWEHK
jgi:hypothetical protein